MPERKHRLIRNLENHTLDSGQRDFGNIDELLIFDKAIHANVVAELYAPLGKI